jgi:hypothetical protein
MARVPRTLRDLLYIVTGRRGQEARSFTGIAARSDYEHFEPLWGWPAAARKAQARGLRLLRENLSPNQNAQYEQCGYFDVFGGETGRRYRIRAGYQMNVYQLDKKGRTVCVLCFAPDGELVVGDVMLAQKLALELFEADTLKVANRFSPDPYLFSPMP